MATKNDIDNGNSFDFGQTSKDYAKYRDIYPEKFYRSIADIGLCINGQKVLDLGTGTGVIPRNMYKYGASFVGSDISENQIKEAKRLSEKLNMNIDYVVSSAENINYPNKYFDVITACQCFWYFDTSIVVPKLNALLKKRGHLCILSMSWLSYESEIAQQSENIVIKYNPNWTGAGYERHSISTPDWLGDMFEVEHAITYDINVPFTRETWNGRIKTCRGIGASSLSDKEIAKFENEHLNYLNSVSENFDILHYVTILNLCKKD